MKKERKEKSGRASVNDENDEISSDKFAASFSPRI